MAITTDQYQQLMRFLDADMSVEEMAAFEQELNAHPELRAQLDLELQVNSSLSASPAIQEGKLRRLPVNRTTWWIAAASVAVIAIVLAYLLVRPSGKGQQAIIDHDTARVHPKDSLRVAPAPAITHRKNTDSLFRQYYKRPGLPATYPIQLADALENFEQHNYTPIEQFDIHHLPLTRGSDDDKETIQVLASFYQGIAALQQQKTDSAISRFSWLIAHYPTHPRTLQAHWFLALAYLQKEDVVNAIKELRIAKANKQYGSDATLLLNSLTP